MFYDRQRNNRKRFRICFPLCLFIMGIFIFTNLYKTDISSQSKVKDTDKNKAQQAATFTPKKDDEKTNTASILAVGDVMVYSAQLNAQYDPSIAKYNFKNNFDYVKKYIDDADYSMANLETTLTGNKVYRYSSSPKFNSPDELADGLKYAGFDLMCTGNNHAYDKGDLSIKNTLSTLKEKKLDVVGTREDNDSRYIVKEINNIKIGITSYSYGKISNNNKYLNDIKISDEYKNNINIFDSSSVNKAFNNINYTLKKMKNTDLQIVYLHWGDSFSLKENSFQKKLAQKLCNAGVDVIIGSHPHVVQSVTTIKSSNNKNETVVAYSLGNFLSNQFRPECSMYAEDGLMLNLDISKTNKDNKAKVTKVNCIPTYINRTYNDKTKKYVYEIIPISNKSDLDKIKNLDENKIKQSYKNTASQIKTSDLINIVDNPFN